MLVLSNENKAILKEKYQIDTPIRIAYFLAHIDHESSGLRRLKESFNYTPEALLKVFRGRITVEQAYKWGRTVTRAANQPMIANTVYGGTWGLRNLGNTQPNDGFFFLGRGALQCTGRANYTRFSRFMKNPEIIIKPWLMESIDLSLEFAGYFWNVNQLNKVADKDNLYFKSIYIRDRHTSNNENLIRSTRIINGGLNGLEDRVHKLNLYKEHFLNL